MDILGMFAKFPENGCVKTRLAEKLGADGATAIYRAFLRDLTRRLRLSAGRRVLCYTPDQERSRSYFAALAGQDFELWSQPAGDLGRRMLSFFTTFLDSGDRVILMGSDSPTLPISIVDEAFSALERSDCVLGPATDGGYYLIGLRAVHDSLFSGIQWSGAQVLSQTVERIRACGLSLELLQPWYDVDTWEDLVFLAGHRRAQAYSEADGRQWEIDNWLDQWNLAEPSRLPVDSALPYEKSNEN